MKLEHLAPYLPYGLKFIDNSGKTYELDGILTGCSLHFKETNRIDYFHSLINHKPILRPLSDLTKEIENNGEKFVPIEFFEEWNTSIDFVKELLALQDDIRWLSVTSYVTYIKLLEWHFDVFGLIEKGEAIDINTI